MLLIAGGAADPQIALLRGRAAERGIDHRVLLTGPGGGVELVWDLESGALRLGGEVIVPGAAFVRQDVFLFLRTKRQLDRDDGRAWKVLLDGWLWSNPDVRLFNRGFAMKDAVNKPLALLWAREAGLAIPRTALHASVAAARAALEAGPVVYKPVAGGDMCRALDTAALDRVSAPHLPRPYIFQERLVPPETRVFRIGERLMAFRVEADALDYRTAGGDVRIAPVPVPEGVTEGLLALTDRLGLNWAAADFKAREGSGEPIFLEVNSSPMFAAFDRASGGALVDGMLDWLTDPAV